MSSPRSTRQRKRGSTQQTSNGHMNHKIEGKEATNGEPPAKMILETPHSSRSERRRVLLLLSCFLGIFLSYFIYGLLQEKISKSDFGGERFRFFMFLVCVQCIINAGVATTVSWYKGESIALKSYVTYGFLSLSYVGAMVSSNKALAYISYPTQVLGKSAKPIPVMLLGVLFNKKRYSLIKYLCILMIVSGVGLFLYKDTPKKNHSSSTTGGESFKLFDTIGIGEALVFLSLFLDGITSCLQEKLKSGHNVTALQMMFGVNCIAPIYLLIGLVITGEGINALQFISRHPTVLFSILIFSIASAVGQIFIFTTITSFGPLTCSVITTTRKFFTILVSVLVFGNALLTRQWIAVVLVFVGLGLDAYFGKKNKTNNQSSPAQQQPQVA